MNLAKTILFLLMAMSMLSCVGKLSEQELIHEVNNLDAWKIPKDVSGLRFRKVDERGEGFSYYVQFYVDNSELESFIDTSPEGVRMYSSDPWKGERPTYNIPWWTVGEGTFTGRYHFSKENLTIRVNVIKFTSDSNLVQIHATVIGRACPKAPSADLSIG